MVCLIGPPASGKTTLAGLLASALHAPMLRPRDATRCPLALLKQALSAIPQQRSGQEA